MKFFTLFITCAICANLISVQQDEKIYLHPNQIRIEERGLFVEIENESVSVEAIHHDVIGIYVIPSEYSLSRCPRGHYSPDGDGLCDESG